MRKQIAGILRESSHAIYKIGVRDRTSSIARNRDYLKSVDQIKGFNSNDKQTIRELLARNFEDGKGMRGSARDIQQAFPDMKRERAEMIARTGHTEINNLAQHEKHLEKGFQSFTIDSTAEACDECNETYQGIVFPMDAVEMLPPLHPRCMCVSVYHEETAEEYAALHGLEVYDGGESEAKEIYADDILNYLNEDTLNFVNDFFDTRSESSIEFGHAFDSNTGKSLSGEIRGGASTIKGLSKNKVDEYVKMGADSVIHNHPPIKSISAPSPSDIHSALGSKTVNDIVVSERGNYLIRTTEQPVNAFRLELELRADAIKAQRSVLDEIENGILKVKNDTELLDVVNQRYEDAMFARADEYGIKIIKWNK